LFIDFILIPLIVITLYSYLDHWEKKTINYGLITTTIIMIMIFIIVNIVY
jgi:hypothetical protein